MPEHVDRDPGKPWQELRPGWDFDGWGAARGGRERWTWVPMRASGADRIVGIVSWSAFSVLVLVYVLTDVMWLGLAALIVVITGAAVRRAIRRFRRLHGSGES